MGYDIYGGRLQPGHCEVHPDVPEPYPCSTCHYNDSGGRDHEHPRPCEDCYYATGQAQDCDGTCRTLPWEQWDYFKHYPEELAAAQASKQAANLTDNGYPRQQPSTATSPGRDKTTSASNGGSFAPHSYVDPGNHILSGDDW